MDTVTSQFITTNNSIIHFKMAHFIKAPCHQSTRKQGFQFGPDEIKEKYDHAIDIKRFSGTKIDANGISICPGYNDLYEYISDYTKQNKDTIIVTVGGDHSVASGSISAINEKYMKQQGQTCHSDLKVLWIDRYPDMEHFFTLKNNNLNDIVMTSLFGESNPSFTNHKLRLRPDQVICFGIDDDYDVTTLYQYGMETYSCNKIKQVGAAKILEILKRSIGDKPLHISIDMKVFDKSVAPSVDPPTNNGLLKEHVFTVLEGLIPNLVSMDLVEFNPQIGSTADAKMTRETARECLIKALRIKENRINIFTENSEFLMYRPLDQVDPISDIGWYILRGLTTEMREDLMRRIPDDTIITVPIDNEDYLVTKTSVDEQNAKSCFIARTIEDTALFPSEKEAMVFELVNSVGFCSDADAATVATVATVPQERCTAGNDSDNEMDIDNIVVAAES